MRRTLLPIIIALCAAFVLQAQTNGTSAESGVNAIRMLYEKGSYSAAEIEARRLLEQPGLSDSLRIAAEQYVSFALVAQGRPKLAVLHFQAILNIDSTFSLDPLYISPKIITALNEAKAIHRAAILKREDQQREANFRASSGGVSWRVAVFPGWEQLHQGRSTKGYLLLGAGAAAAALSIGFEFERSRARQEYLDASSADQATARYDRYNRAWKAEAYSLIALAAIYVYSEIDAIVNLPSSDAISLTPQSNGFSLSVRF